MAATFRQTGRKIVAIGRNFADHAKELNNAVPKEPFFFLKPTSSYISSGEAIEIPKVELAVVMGKQGRDIDKKHADEYVGGYALAIDMTARNVQDKAKKQGLPWSAAKGFDTFTPISDFVPKKLIQDSSDVELWLKVNDQLKQNGNTQDMIFNVPTLLAHVSSIMTLEVGDVLLTGTPKGVGQVKPGDNITAGLQLPGSSNILAQLKLQAKQRQGGFVFDE